MDLIPIKRRTTPRPERQPSMWWQLFFMVLAMPLYLAFMGAWSVIADRAQNWKEAQSAYIAYAAITSVFLVGGAILIKRWQRKPKPLAKSDIQEAGRTTTEWVESVLAAKRKAS